MIEISKELILKLIPLELNEEHDKYYETKIGNTLNIGYSYNVLFKGNKVGSGAKHFNIYELAHKCKEWAVDNHFHIYSKIMKDKAVAKIRKSINGKHRKNTLCLFVANTEPEAVFKVCQWILDNQKKEKQIETN